MVGIKGAAADVIFCTTPSTQALFPARYLTSEEARCKTRYIAAIGSYRLDMTEIDPELLKTIIDPQGVFSDQVWNGRVVVDSASGCLQEAGGLVKAGIGSDQMHEVGKLHHTLSVETIAELENGFNLSSSCTKV
ncbi:hypothetical protein F5X99DRAFT_84433 [Biscogniauxia marginata]|nr:hypothetical protein F5X99DRAFT_84433 [Biscogniauxia marginata]